MESKMKPTLVLFCMLLVLSLIPGIQAVTYNTTVTVDWIGNNNCYIRTESGDMFFNAAPENQTDQTFMVNITRSNSNQTDLEDKFNMIYGVCREVSTERNYTNNLFNEVLFNYSRCAANQQAAWDETYASRDTMRMFQSMATNTTVACQANISVMQQSMNYLQASINGYSIQLQNQTAQTAQAKKSGQDNILLGILIGAGGIGGIWWYQNNSKGQNTRPKEARDQGFGSGVRN
jgi:hypothetical protein